MVDENKLKIGVCIFIGFLSFLWVEKPLREMLSSSQIDILTDNYCSGVLVRLTIIYFSFLLVKKLRFKKFVGSVSTRKYKNIRATFISFILILLELLAKWNTYYNSEIHTLILFGLFVLSVGFVEEIIFRGTIFPLFI